MSQQLCEFLLTYCSSIHSTTGATPSSLFLKREVRQPNLKTNVWERQLKQKVDHDKHTRVRHFSVGDAVMIKNICSGPDCVPGIIVSKFGPLSYLVETTDNHLACRLIDHLKTRIIDSEVFPVPQPTDDDPETVC